MLRPENEWILERAVREMDKAARAYSPDMHDHIVSDEGKILYKIEGRDEYGPWSWVRACRWTVAPICPHTCRPL